MSKLEDQGFADRFSDPARALRQRIGSIHREFLTGDEAGRIAREKRDNTGHIFRGPHALHRDSSDVCIDVRLR